MIRQIQLFAQKYLQAHELAAAITVSLVMQIVLLPFFIHANSPWYITYSSLLGIPFVLILAKIVPTVLIGLHDLLESAFHKLLGTNDSHKS